MDNYMLVKSKELMKTIIGNYEYLENKYEGYTSKKEAMALICSCYSKGWDDLGDVSLKTFNLEPFKAELKHLALTKPKKQDYQILLEDILNSKQY